MNGRASDGSFFFSDVVTPADGAFEFVKVPPGTYELLVEAQGCPVKVRGPSGEKAEIKIVVPQRNGSCVAR